MKYTAPECLNPELAPDERADVFSLAVVTNEMLCDNLEVGKYQNVCAKSTNMIIHVRHPSIKSLLEEINSVKNYHGKVLAYQNQPLSKEALDHLAVTLTEAKSNYSGPWKRITSTVTERVFDTWIGQQLNPQLRENQSLCKTISDSPLQEVLQLQTRVQQDLAFIQQMEKIEKKYLA